MSNEGKAELRNAAQVVLDNLEARKSGRPTTFHPGFCHLAEQACIINATGPMLADLFGSDDVTVSNWMTAHPHFLKAIKRGKEKTDEEVEAALVHRAKGYSHQETHVASVPGVGVVRTELTKRYPPSEIAAMFWLKNRKPKEWRPDSQLAPVGAPVDDAAAQLRAAMAGIDSATEGEK